MTTRRVLVIAAGDQAGSNNTVSMLLSRLRELPVAGRWWLTLIGDAQFQVEHALDLQLNDLAVFIDSTSAVSTRAANNQDQNSGRDKRAGDGQSNGVQAADGVGTDDSAPREGAFGSPGFTFRRLDRPAGHRISPMNDALSPSDVLHTLSTIGRRETLPACFLLTVNEEALPNAAPASAEAVNHASAFLSELLSNPEPERWEERITP